MLGTNIIRIAMTETNTTLKELATRVGTSSQNLDNKMKRDNFSEAELNAIATALGFSLKIQFCNKKTGEVISSDNL